MLLRTVLRQVRRILLTALLGGLLGATLVRLGPGFGVDERELDNRLSAESQAAIRAEHAADNNIALFYCTLSGGIGARRFRIFDDRSTGPCGAAKGTPAADAGLAGLWRAGRHFARACCSPC